MTMPSLPSVVLPYRLGLKLANTVVYFSLVLLHIYNTVRGEPSCLQECGI